MLNILFYNIMLVTFFWGSIMLVTSVQQYKSFIT